MQIRVPTGIDSRAGLPISNTRKKNQSVSLYTIHRFSYRQEDIANPDALKYQKNSEKEPSLMRGKEVYETSARVVEKEVEGIIQL